MREIIFRGKRMDNREWYYGSYLFLHISSVNWTGAKMGKPEDVHYIVNDQDINYAVYPSTIGQYTGLKDKNGKRIFEGDIIKRFWLGAKIIYCVRYDGENAHFIGKSLNKSGFTTFDGDGEMFEVIGNIHDNPELLEVGGDDDVGAQ